MPTYLIPRDVETLAEAIREARYSYQQLGIKVGVSGQQLGRLVAGKRERINAAAASLIEETLGKPRGSLFRVEEDADLSPYLPEDAA